MRGCRGSGWPTRRDLSKSRNELRVYWRRRLNSGARNRILDERRIRITKEGTEKRAAVAALHKATAGMRADTARLNELIGKHTKQQEALSNETGVLELSFRAELKEFGN